MRMRKHNYAEIYNYAKEHGKDKAISNYGISPGGLSYIMATGDDLLASMKRVSTPPRQDGGKTIDKFTPRELMEELARRGYAGKLTYTATIDIRNF